MRAAIARLTANERECLRRRLRAQTAKEMAIDLGISPHAVEKRLKMARAKLGVSSSLAAARLLDATEDQVPVPRASDLSPGGAVGEATGGAAAMVPGASIRSSGGRLAMFIVLLAALLPQASVPSAPAIGAYRSASPEEVRAYVHDSFLALDRDRSGFIERDEAPIVGLRDDAAKPQPTELIVRGTTGQGMWIVLEDKDRDGRVSEAEYGASRLPFSEAHGVPVDWHPAAAVGAN